MEQPGPHGHIITNHLSSIPETLEHKWLVSHYISLIVKELLDRAEKHDNSKMEPGEVEYFDKLTPMVNSVTYGSDEYKAFLETLRPALAHHYSLNRHHPEHHKGGIEGMDLVDLVEMLCDWKASTLRQQDGDILASIDKNQSRFKYGDELSKILVNTANNKLKD